MMANGKDTPRAARRQRLLVMCGKNCRAHALRRNALTARRPCDPPAECL
jgi:hypothetical protein